jgi:hypothetical protein
MFQKIINATLLAFILFLASCEDAPSPVESVATSEARPGAATEVSDMDSDSARLLIKTGEVKLSVTNLDQSIKEIQAIGTELGAHAMHYEINSNRQHQEDIPFSMDSSYSIYQTTPEAHLRLKIPKANADSFIHSLLSLHEAKVDYLLLDEDDVTEDWHERKDLIAPIIPANKHTVALKTRQYDDERVETMIHRKSLLNKLTYKTQFLWFDVRLTAATQVDKMAVARLPETREPMPFQMAYAFQKGFYSMSWLIIGLITLWPYLIIGLVLYVAYKKGWLFKRWSLLKHP